MATLRVTNICKVLPVRLDYLCQHMHTHFTYNHKEFQLVLWYALHGSANNTVLFCDSVDWQEWWAGKGILCIFLDKISLLLSQAFLHMYLQGSKLHGEHCALKSWSFHDFSNFSLLWQHHLNYLISKINYTDKSFTIT